MAATYNGPIRQAITTRYHGATDTKGARVSATAAAGRIYLPWDHALDIVQNHYAAAIALRDRFEWASALVGGGLSNCDYVWVLTDAP